MLTERRDDGLADRHRCHLHESGGGRPRPRVLLWVVKSRPGRRTGAVVRPPLRRRRERRGRRRCEFRPVGKSVVGRVAGEAAPACVRSDGTARPPSRTRALTSLFYPGRGGPVKPRGRVGGGEGRLSRTRAVLTLDRRRSPVRRFTLPPNLATMPPGAAYFVERGCCQDQSGSARDSSGPAPAGRGTAAADGVRPDPPGDHAMKNLLAFLGAAVLVFAGVGLYLNWFTSPAGRPRPATRPSTSTSTPTRSNRTRRRAARRSWRDREGAPGGREEGPGGTERRPKAIRRMGRRRRAAKGINNERRAGGVSPLMEGSACTFIRGLTPPARRAAYQRNVRLAAHSRLYGLGPVTGAPTQPPISARRNRTRRPPVKSSESSKLIGPLFRPRWFSGVLRCSSAWAGSRGSGRRRSRPGRAGSRGPRC